ncbi:endonuclease III [bacterium]|nr:endonuclease III [bacterium]
MARESLKKKQARAQLVFDTLTEKFPNVGTFLTHNNTFELLIAVILSAQCTDERVNMVTPSLFANWATPEALGNAPLENIKKTIKSINFFNNKAINIQKSAKILQKEYDSIVPDSLDELIQLPGVGRKTANVVLGQAFGQQGITVDTHVKRLCNRLGLTKYKDAVKAEFELMNVWPKDSWTDFSSILILQGRQVCKAINPQCEICELTKECPKVDLKQ